MPVLLRMTERKVSRVGMLMILQRIPLDKCKYNNNKLQTWKSSHVPCYVRKHVTFYGAEF
jgi:hypothetical protein